MKQEMLVASAGPRAHHLHLTPEREHHATTSAFEFYRTDALPDGQPAMSKHWWQLWLVTLAGQRQLQASRA